MTFVLVCTQDKAQISCMGSPSTSQRPSPPAAGQHQARARSEWCLDRSPALTGRPIRYFVEQVGDIATCHVDKGSFSVNSRATQSCTWHCNWRCTLGWVRWFQNLTVGSSAKKLNLKHRGRNRGLYSCHPNWSANSWCSPNTKTRKSPL